MAIGIYNNMIPSKSTPRLLNDASTAIQHSGSLQSFRSINAAISYLKKAVPIIHNYKPYSKPFLDISPPASSSLSEMSLGPGSYNVSYRENGPSHVFSPVPRFPNIRLSSYRPTKSGVKTDRHISKESKMQKYKETREHLFKKRQTMLKQKLNNKFKKLEYKLNKEVYGNFRKKWIAILSMFGCVTNAFYNIKHRKKVKTFLGVFAYASKIIGTFRAKLRDIRTRKAKSKIKRLLIPLFSKKLDQVREQHRQRVLYIIYEKKHMQEICQVIRNLKHKRELVRRTVRNYIHIRRARFACVFKLFERIKPKEWSSPIKVHLVKYIQQSMVRYLENLKYHIDNRQKIEEEYFKQYYHTHLESLKSKKQVQPFQLVVPPPMLHLYSPERLKAFLNEFVKIYDVQQKVKKPKRRRNKKRMSIIKPRSYSKYVKSNTNQSNKQSDQLPEIPERPRVASKLN